MKIIACLERSSLLDQNVLATTPQHASPAPPSHASRPRQCHRCGRGRRARAEPTHRHGASLSPPTRTSSAREPVIGAGDDSQSANTGLCEKMIAVCLNIPAKKSGLAASCRSARMQHFTRSLVTFLLLYPANATTRSFVYSFGPLRSYNQYRDYSTFQLSLSPLFCIARLTRTRNGKETTL